MSKLLIGQLQFQINYDDIRSNIDTALSLAEKALSNQRLDFLTLPEMWNTGFVAKSKILDNIDSTGYILNKFCQLAAHYSCHIVCGSLPELANGSLYNTSILIDDKGNITGKYRKHKLFPLMNEPALFSQGEAPQVIQTKHAKIAMSICYDLRFPELYTALRKQNVQIVFLQAQFPAPRVDHWTTLNKARAIENQVYLVATNAVGRSGKYDFFGRSMVINPWGEIVADAQDMAGFFINPIDLNEIDKVREKLPMLWE